MRNRICVLVLMFLIFFVRPAVAGPIDYTLIPAQTSGYLHMDLDRWMASHVLQELGYKSQIAGQIDSMFGGPIASITVYLKRSEDSETLAILVRGDPKMLEKLKATATNAKGSVLVHYGDQEVYFTPAGGIEAILLGRRTSHKKATPASTAQPTRRSAFTLGFGTSSGASTFPKSDQGPSYVAFRGVDLVVITTDLGTMAEALDVIDGKKPSLAQQDPLELKLDVSPQTIVVAAGLAAQVSLDHPNPAEQTSATQPAKSADAPAGNFGFDFFGSLKGHARLARLEVGENEHSLYATASIVMTDADSAEQMKNLIVGVKALLSLSREKQKPLVDPLEIQSAGKSVSLHWSWPTAKLSDLIRLGSGDHDDSLPATNPAAK